MISSHVSEVGALDPFADISRALSAPSAGLHVVYLMFSSHVLAFGPGEQGQRFFRALIWLLASGWALLSHMRIISIYLRQTIVFVLTAVISPVDLVPRVSYLDLSQPGTMLAVYASTQHIGYCLLNYGIAFKKSVKEIH